MDDKNKKEIFHFDDNEDEEYEFVLPPECKISQDGPHSSISTNKGCLDLAETGKERKVSFNTEKNEYYYVERHSDQEDTACFDADDEFRPKEFEIEILPPHEPVESIDDVKLASGMDRSGVSEALQIGNDAAHTNEAPVTLAPSWSCKVPSSAPRPRSNSLQQIIDDVSEFVSSIRIERDRLKNTLAKDPPMPAKDELLGAQVVRESLPSIKDNPFILRDRMNLK